ncbi:adenosylcobinamide-phosphate synthase CbiB [Ferrimonas aestuarii]|uniref:Cobalamin biosynthesis protein CobD n=1 Tax=Ferrimonas aestuarii TaxID=2569539 RepID=A0A4U1BG03_9GAMM|nr:adenosylcobinamide-phosphate synthase CbiB [Ferrimonas aestuarii]TKB50059.1 cobalamin biosynthesis protein [Ferrimonas aestuarii]
MAFELLHLTLAITLALILDKLFGELPRFHPLVAYGRFARAIEKRLWNTTKRRGKVAVILALIPALMFLLLPEVWWLQGLVLYLVIGGRSLGEHGRMVSSALRQNDLNEARAKVGWIVSRETHQMDEKQVVSATMESMLENGNDAVFGALFWFIVGGAPAAVLYRMSNTLDAMWGYKNPRFLNFGWAAAKLDDLLNYLPARLCALTYCVLGSAKTGWRCWQQQANACDSPNGGPVMTAGAGALMITIGGDAVYHGQLKQKALMGDGPYASANDIDRAIALVERGQWLWLALITITTLLVFTPEIIQL